MGHLIFKNVNKIYENGFHAVKDFNLEIEHSEFVVIVGPSGCGKSTVLRMAAGLESITSGEMILNNKVVNKVAPADRDIAFVFQDYALYGNLSVYENVGMSMKVKHESEDKIYDKVMEAADGLGLNSLLNSMPNQLSGGQKQRVALGRAMIRHPQVSLMDEPLSNLDAKLRTTTRSEIVNLQKELNVTTMYVTHDQIEAMTMADRIVIMKDGTVQQIGKPGEIYNKPSNVFVAGFIGSPCMNFFDVTVNGNKVIIHGSEFIIPDDRMSALKTYDGKKIILGLRPENFENKDKKVNTLYLKCRVKEFLGDYYNMHMEFGDSDIACCFKSPEENAQGELAVYFNLENANFFDAETTNRIQ